MNMVTRVGRRYRMAREQARPLRLSFMVAPIHRRSPFLLRRRLRELGAHDAGAYIRELDENGIHSRTDAAIAEYCVLAPQFAPGPGSVNALEGALLYGLVRVLRPATVVETGTASGISTTYLLAALERNGAGRLTSIDLPFEAGVGLEVRPIIPGTAIDLYDSSPVPEGKESGWAVPDELRGRWELRLGDSRTLLPDALEELGEIQVFFHDSLHSREHMLFEFEAAWPHLARRGVLIADDVFQRKHDALPAFARQVGRPFSTFGNLGLIRK